MIRMINCGKSFLKRWNAVCVALHGTSRAAATTKLVDAIHKSTFHEPKREKLAEDFVVEFSWTDCEGISFSSAKKSERKMCISLFVVYFRFMRKFCWQTDRTAGCVLDNWTDRFISHAHHRQRVFVSFNEIIGCVFSGDGDPIGVTLFCWFNAVFIVASTETDWLTWVTGGMIVTVLCCLWVFVGDVRFTLFSPVDISDRHKWLCFRFLSSFYLSLSRTLALL